MIRSNDAEKTIQLGVHDLIEVGPPEGDLQLQVAWSARARMRAGQQAHGEWQARRASEDEAYHAEVTVRHTVVVRGWEVTISGRLDGLSREGGQVVVEEVKSTVLPASRLDGRGPEDFPAWTRQLHLYLHFLEQAQVGGGPDVTPLALLRGAQMSGTTGVVGRLVLVSLADGSRRVLQVEPSADTGAWIERQLGWIVLQRERRVAWLGRRRSAAVPFAHDDWRPGQDDLAHEVEELLHQGRHVLLSAPTGYGKTAAVLFSAVRQAYATDRRVFIATARTTQQRMAEDTVREMAARGLPVRAVSIRARDKACLNYVSTGDGGVSKLVVCRPESCPYADGYFDRVREGQLVERLWRLQAPSPEDVAAVAEEQRVCPFALSIDLASEADVVIGDFNYLFDPGVRLAEVAEHPGEWVAIVDEIHNLPERAMGYGSPEVSLATAEAAVDVLAGGGARWRGCLEVVEDTANWLRAGVERVPEGARDDEAAFPLFDEQGERSGEGLRESLVRDLARRFDELALPYALLKLERPLFEPGEVDPWMDTARAVLRMRAALERAERETVVIWRRAAAPPRGQMSLLGPHVSAGPGSGVRLLCRDPSRLLAPSFADFASSVGMSATLEPSRFFVAMAGLDPERSRVVRRPSPFPPENRRVLVLPGVSTEYRHRRRDRQATADLISAALQAVPGNVAVYFPSFAFLEQVAPLLETGARPVLAQGRGMDERARAALLETMARGAGHALLAVLGGIFAEGIDLPGDALLAAVVVGPALPPANLERRLLQAWFEERYGEGRRYAWLVPGMNRVVQAAGRVVRTSEDRGAIVLVGRRFLQRAYQEFFPDDWEPVRTDDPAVGMEGLWGGRYSRSGASSAPGTR